MIDYEELAEAMGDLDEDTVKELLKRSWRTAARRTASDGCLPEGMDIVGSPV